MKKDIINTTNFILILVCCEVCVELFESSLYLRLIQKEKGMESDSDDEMADYEELLLLQLIQKNLNANFLIIYCSYKRKSFVS